MNPNEHQWARGRTGVAPPQGVRGDARVPARARLGDHRPERRMIVPGGMTCADPEGPRLSWLWIGGSSSSDVEGAFEAHVMSCDHCFEFHYRTRHAIRVLREKKAMLTETGTRERPLTQVLAQAVRERCAGFVHREALIRGT